MAGAIDGCWARAYLRSGPVLKPIVWLNLGLGRLVWGIGERTNRLSSSRSLSLSGSVPVMDLA
jgi:hypothetical protein